MIQNALSNCEEIQHAARGLFVLALQQVVDSFIAGLLTDEAFEWLTSSTGSSSENDLEKSSH
jgi:hypothetical protein